ncbi:hypothetical protein BDQ12DRAFT_132542 [Crucibulum laeve]|uniref:Uncharacterized protein n=1 Tax=Crucibulum laeve TaxID=68775 RepID=A0A5C3LZ38_9AGAR|nr:hypothetical protein BDQ12DRAFT_132542 [Crucibulum laeve]
MTNSPPMTISISADSKVPWKLFSTPVILIRPFVERLSLLADVHLKMPIITPYADRADLTERMLARVRTMGLQATHPHPNIREYRGCVHDEQHMKRIRLKLTINQDTIITTNWASTISTH